MSDLSLPELLHRTARAFGIAKAELTGPCRSRHHVEARSGFVYAARRHGYSYPEIGDVANRDHTSCINLMRRAERQRMHDHDFAAKSDLVDAGSPIVFYRHGSLAA